MDYNNQNYPDSSWGGNRGYAVEAEEGKLVRNVYLWMTLALCVTGLVAWCVSSTPSLMSIFFGNPGIIIGLAVCELALVMIISWAINKLSFSAAMLLFILYSVVNGITLSSIFLVYSLGSIASAFFVAAGTFLIMAFYGTVTGKDLSKIGSLALMALVGVIIATLVNLLFIKSGTMDLVISCVAVFIFIGLTAYDAQKIKALLGTAEASETASKIAVLGALSLYLDFINIFLYLLRLFGRRD